MARIEMSALNDDGLLGDAVDKIYAQVPAVHLHKVEALARGMASPCSASPWKPRSMETVDSIVTGLRHLPNRNVDRVQPMSLPALGTGRDPQPAGGRQQSIRTAACRSTNARCSSAAAADLQRIIEWLQAGAGSIWLRGQKRVGKTSLLLHLKRYHLEDHGCVPVFVDFQLLSSMDRPSIFYEVAGAIYSELQSDGSHGDARAGEFGAPLRELFAHDPSGQFVAYVRGVQRQLAPAGWSCCSTNSAAPSTVFATAGWMTASSISGAASCWRPCLRSAT